MQADSKYTNRVTLGADGIYRWKSLVQLDSDKSGYRLGLVVCVVVCVVSIGICAVISVDYMISILPVIIGSVAAAILFFWLVSKFANSMAQKYEMNEDHVKIGEQKDPVFFDEIKEIVVNPRYLELHEKERSAKVYVPKEDFFFVKDYIITHTLGHAVITYDRYGITGNLEE